MTDRIYKPGQHVLVNGCAIGTVRKFYREKGTHSGGRHIVSIDGVTVMYTAYGDELEPLTPQEYFTRKLKWGSSLLDPVDH